MRKIYAIFFLLFFVICTGIFFQKNLSDLYLKYAYYSPCDNPITYSIGTIDSGFNTTAEELKKDAAQAAQIWNKAEGKDLLEYDQKSSFTINMVYDDRQALTTKINDLNNDLKQKQSDIDPKISDFEKRRAEFEAKVQTLNNDISYWNSQGGAPKDEYDKLVARQNELKTEANALNAEAISLGQETSDYNSSARKLNKTIDNYQGVLVTKPEEGLFEQDGTKKKISIYIDVDRGEFLHTLAHEFGHSLGLNHNTNPSSIMYPQTNNVLTPSSDDLSALSQICKRRSFIEIASTRVDQVVKALRQKFNKN